MVSPTVSKDSTATMVRANLVFPILTSLSALSLTTVLQTHGPWGRLKVILLGCTAPGPCLSIVSPSCACPSVVNDHPWTTNAARRSAAGARLRGIWEPAACFFQNSLGGRRLRLQRGKSCASARPQRPRRATIFNEAFCQKQRVLLTRFGPASFASRQSGPSRALVCVKRSLSRARLPLTRILAAPRKASGPRSLGEGIRVIRPCARRAQPPAVSGIMLNADKRRSVERMIPDSR